MAPRKRCERGGDAGVPTKWVPTATAMIAWQVRKAAACGCNKRWGTDPQCLPSRHRGASIGEVTPGDPGRWPGAAHDADRRNEEKGIGAQAE